MFNTLSEKITESFKKLSGQGIINESNLTQSLRDIRIALLEADVALPVAKDFIEKIKVKALGQNVINSISPGQMIIKIVQDELISILGSENKEINLNCKPPIIIMMIGLQGSGKTTSSAKLAYRLSKKDKKNVLMASLDVYRPAAQEQLGFLGKENHIDTLEVKDGEDPESISKRAFKKAKLENFDILILDSAGRNHVDKKMMDELVKISKILEINENLLVVDSMAGQDAVNTAKSFSEIINISGIVLTRVDGDSRGGAALSMKTITEKPIKFIGVGEKIEDFEEFHPDRIASRILDMGDVVSLVEKATEQINQEDAKKLQGKILKGRFTLSDYLKQLDQISNMGGIKGLMKFLPGMNKFKDNLNQANENSEVLKIQKSIILSMTKKERYYPDLIKSSRKIRISRGSGTKVQDINKLLKQFKKMSQMMKKMGKNKKLESMMNSQNMDDLSPLLNKLK